MASMGNTVEEQPPRHPKVKGSSLAGTGREKWEDSEEINRWMQGFLTEGEDTIQLTSL